jgi:hypothetical protein
MHTKEVKNCLEKVQGLFEKAFITLNTELILEPKNNVYFRLADVQTKLDFDCKMIEYLSRPAHKGMTKKFKIYFSERLNKYFNKSWNNDELSIIYTYLGGGCNRKLCIKFIKSNFDINLLKIEES